jgi:hypothetical protein
MFQNFIAEGGKEEGERKENSEIVCQLICRCGVFGATDIFGG